MQYVTLLHLLLPPLVGAAIGYITNALAIRMLFRPLKEYRVGPLRLPFTPGIIPRQRHALAVSIARMVSRELLTERALKQRLEDPGFRQRVYDKLSDLVERLLTLPLHSLAQTIPAEVREASVSWVQGALKEAFEQKNPFRDLLKEGLEILWNTPLPPNISSSIVQGMKHSEELKQILNRTKSILKDTLYQGVTVKELFSKEVEIETLKSFLEPLYPKIIQYLSKVLRTPEVKRELELQGRFLLWDILQQLSFFQRLLITAGQYDRTLEERMPFIVEEAIAALERTGEEGPLKRQVLFTLARELDRFLSKPLKELLALLPEEGIEGFLGNSLGWITETLLGQLQIKGEIRLGDWIGQATGIPREELTGRTLRFFQSILFPSEKDKAQPIESLLKNLLQNLSRSAFQVLGDKTLKDLLPLSEEEKHAVNTFILRKIFDILSTKIPAIISVLDIEELVIQRIDELDIQEVEGLLLSVISRHLQWINFFGGVLGALIGGVQVLLQYIK
ncbi:MAG: DUF445 family protein [Spirochaetales bacterium]